MNLWTSLAYTFGIVLLYVAIWLLHKPLRGIGKILFSSVWGLVALVAFNFVGGFVGLKIGVNLCSAIVAGSLGLPGIGLMLVLQTIFV